MSENTSENTSEGHRKTAGVARVPTDTERVVLRDLFVAVVTPQPGAG